MIHGSRKSVGKICDRRSRITRVAGCDFTREIGPPREESRTECCFSFCPRLASPRNRDTVHNYIPVQANSKERERWSKNKPNTRQQPKTTKNCNTNALQICSHLSQCSHYPVTQAPFKPTKSPMKRTAKSAIHIAPRT